MIDPFAVFRFLGESLLRPVDKFNLKDFLKAWEGSVPQGLTPDLTQLQGLALTDTTTSPPVSADTSSLFFRAEDFTIFVACVSF